MKQNDTFIYVLPAVVRNRIMYTFQHLMTQMNGNDICFYQMFDEVGPKLQMKYGGLFRPAYEMARQSDNPVIEHFFCAPDKEAFEFVALCFQAFSYSTLENQGVKAINEIFQENSIGYEFTPMAVHVEERSSTKGRGGRKVTFDYPKLINRSAEYVHQQVVKPALEVLGKAAFAMANAEMLKAHDDFRQAKYEDAITSAGSAFESVLKTILASKKWTYDPHKDTCKVLVERCAAENLFPSFYTPILTGVGTIRNKLGDAHGRGPTPLYVVSRDDAEHMIQIVSTHILYLIKLAGLA